MIQRKPRVIAHQTPPGVGMAGCDGRGDQAAEGQARQVWCSPVGIVASSGVQHLEALVHEVVQRPGTGWVPGSAVPQEVVADDPAPDGQVVDHQVPHVEVQAHAVDEDQRWGGHLRRSSRAVRPEVGAARNGAHPSVNPISSMSE